MWPKLRSWSITIRSKQTFVVVVDVTQSDNLMVVDEYFIGAVFGFL